MQTASATGGLRGGNTQAGLADFGRDTLSQMIGTRLSRLSGLAGIGQGATDSISALGAHTSDNISSGLTSIGNSKMNSILGQQQAWNNMGTQISSILSQFIPGMGGF